MGKVFFLWHDRWWGPEPLSSVIPLETIDHGEFHQNLKVKDMVCNGNWNWPTNWINDYPILLTIPAPSLCDSSDRYMWSSNDGRCCNYATNRAWQDLRQAGNKVEWFDLVWFSNCTPKHSFIVWIAIQGRLSTQDRIQKWYPDKVMTCPLCNSCLDSLNHLFFECSFSNKVWTELKIKAERNDLPNKWDEIIRNMVSVKHNRSIKSIMSRILFAACVYFIWHERNKRLFTNEKNEAKEVSMNVINYMRLKLSSLTVRKTTQIENVCKNWGVVMNEKL